MMIRWILSIFFVGLSQVAVAQNGPCRSDVEKLCAGVERGGGRIAKCLKDNEAQLSAECKARREAMKSARKEFHEACEDDVQSLCDDVKPGMGRIKRCLKDNSEKLSADCKKAWEAKREARRSTR